MDIVDTVAGVRAWRRRAPGRLGLVPTMGYLHEGHLSLVRRARDQSDSLAASLFVNPTQFGPKEDLARYPRDLPRDQRLLKGGGCDLLFTPSVEEMYPAGFSTVIDVGPLAERLEGKKRRGHFRAVATVVAKLFGIFEPARAYFGEKDAQQLAVIRWMVRDLNLPVEIVACPTVREPDGLAMSSRNSYLNPTERLAASALYRALQAAKERWQKGGRRSDALRSAMRKVLVAQPLARIDYATVADPESFEELEGVIAQPALLLLAVYIGSTRLIDNLLLTP
jgi:pantoate--beta-alanine ligase